MARPSPRLVSASLAVAPALTGAGPVRVRVAVLALTLTVAGCATSPTSVKMPQPDARPPTVQTGLASWYGKRHHGQRTANGERFDMFQFTAAHRTLPLGTRLVVTNLKNGRTVEVRVNDRGPVPRGRIIDLSYAAADELGALSDGVISVRARVVSMPAR
jgi:peptidoglycan lytic transglycosylase